MEPVRHCRHCWGDCPGDCLLPGDQGLCIHRYSPRLTFRERLRAAATRRFWHRVFWGA
jgi:hypothetical protein